MRLAIVIALATASTARAGAPGDQDVPLADNVDPDAAMKLSAIGTAMPLAMIGLGSVIAATGSNNVIRDTGAWVAVAGALTGVVTPSLGQLYSHHYFNGTMAMRAGGLFITTVGLVFAANNDVGDCAGEPEPCHLKPRTIGLIATGAALYLGGMAIDVLTARDDARSWNTRHLQIAPTALRTPTSLAPGVALALTF